MGIEWLDAFNDAIATFRGALGLVRDVRDTLPEGQRKAVDEALEQADKAARIAEAQIAKGLGYKLCTCKFPPTVMLYAGEDEEATFLSEGDFHKCPACGREEPSKRMRRRGLGVA
jgi:hypothetical protein